MVHMTFLAEHNCLSSCISVPVDAFSIANFLWRFSDEGKGKEPIFTTEVVTADGQPVTANGGITVQPDKSVKEVKKTDIILIPAFFPPFDFDDMRFKEISAWLISRHNTGTCIAAACTGTFLLAKTGLLNGKLATTNWMMASLFQKMYPDVELRIDRIFTEDSGIYCSGAATALLDLGLHIVEKFGSVELAKQCSKALLVDPGRKTQMPYITYDFWKNHSDPEILKCQQWMEESYTTKLSMDILAQKAGMSPRHFKRRFKNATGKSPLTYLQHLRIEDAKQRLETTPDTVNEITWAVGYEDINSFRRLFKKHTGMSPKAYRNKFSWQTRIHQPGG